MDSQHNFSVGDFVNPENQDAKTALVLWYGVHWVSNRRKQGVLFGHHDHDRVVSRTPNKPGWDWLSPGNSTPAVTG